MRDSKLTSEECFGKYHDKDFKLQLNSIQSMVYKEGDVGPFYLSPQQREQRKYDNDTKKTWKKYYVRSFNVTSIGIISRGNLKSLRE